MATETSKANFMSIASNGSFSADVQLSLRMDNTIFPLHKVSPTRVVVRKPVDLPIGYADVIVSVDGKSQISPVYLPNGASSHSSSVQLEPVEACQSST